MSSPTSCAPSLSSSVAKRKEPKTACLLCRRRKVACDRRRPKCGLCSRNDFDCTYTARERRPGLRAGYVSQLEERIGRSPEYVRAGHDHYQTTCYANMRTRLALS
ncbi:uncharacterized protein BCR38DRAFT_215738 [Pseudomassariella vexata]|uniref:Zn(2)-C6 fungal-type domain-containing protein n=1 Tax=Pseudomassariella vexata TaxID=1141098 RepID=A0A1Y2DZF0_9PEZI|nr:uncharacterized protein BCR38DRAFT_215738 [Pseudomassariella vexata]ORY64476.1 hypothetical protein BCR38DRAFT_215738 [Pseudomassariella vexata]